MKEIFENAMIIVFLIGIFSLGWFGHDIFTDSNKRFNYLFDDIARHLVEEQDYRDDYDCDEFSHEAIRRLKDAGYNAYFVYGCVNETGMCNETKKGHAWGIIEVPYEFTVGMPVDIVDYRKSYNEIRVDRDTCPKCDYSGIFSMNLTGNVLSS